MSVRLNEEKTMKRWWIRIEWSLVLKAAKRDWAKKGRKLDGGRFNGAHAVVGSQRPVDTICFDFCWVQRNVCFQFSNWLCLFLVKNEKKRKKKQF